MSRLLFRVFSHAPWRTLLMHPSGRLSRHVSSLSGRRVTYGVGALRGSGLLCGMQKDRHRRTAGLRCAPPAPGDDPVPRPPRCLQLHPAPISATPLMMDLYESMCQETVLGSGANIIRPRDNTCARIHVKRGRGAWDYGDFRINLQEDIATSGASRRSSCRTHERRTA